MPDLDAQDQILAEQFNQSALLANANINTRSDISDRPLRIAIQNATGFPDQARLMADYLIQQELGDFYGNLYVIEDWPIPLSETRIIAQRGDRESAQRLQTYLNLGVVEATSTGAIESDITIRLGQDSMEFLRQHE